MKVTKTILIAEDEKQTSDTLNVVLKNAGYRVLQSQNGQETLSIILDRQSSKESVDLLILDREMSGLTGWKVLGELKEVGIHLPVIVVTGLMDERKPQGSEEHVSLTYLTKPFEPDDVLACVAHLLSSHTHEQTYSEEAEHALEEEPQPSQQSEPDAWNELPVTFSIRRSFMNLADLLHENCIQAGAEVSDKRSVLHAIAQLAHKHPILAEKSVEEIERGLIEREDTGSTGFGDFIAIPHCALDDLSDFVLGMLTVPDGVDFDSIDGQPTKLFVFIIAPASQRNEHIRVLSAISSVLRSPANVREILEANTPAAIRASFLRHTHIEIDEKQKGYNLFTVIVQRQAVFEDILSLFAEIPESYLSVIEANNAGRYLYALPLFANFWNPEKKGFQRIIQATVKKPRANETLRKLNLLLEDLKITSGVLVLLQDVLYMNGEIDL